VQQRSPGQRYCSKAFSALLQPAQVRGTEWIYQAQPAERTLHAVRQRTYWARCSGAKLASLCEFPPALATSSQSALIRPSPRALRPGQSIHDTKLPIQTDASRRRREDDDVDHIR